MKTKLIALLIAASCLLTACGVGGEGTPPPSSEPPSAAAPLTREFERQDVNLLVFNLSQAGGYWYLDSLAAA